VLVGHGTYRGDGVQGRRIEGWEISAAVLFIACREQSRHPVVWIDTMGPGEASWDGIVGLVASSAIVKVNHAGIILGADVAVNEPLQPEALQEFAWLALGKDTHRGRRDLVTGSYVGDGNDDRTIPIGFANPTKQPLIVGVGRFGDSFVVRDALHGDGESARLFDSTDVETNKIKAFGVDSFEVGSDDEVNAAGSRYYFFAIADDGKDGSVHLGGWTGNGVPEYALTGTPLPPDAVIIDGTDAGGTQPTLLALKGTPPPRAWQLGVGVWDPSPGLDAIHSWDPTGITVNSHLAVNRDGRDFHGWFFSTVGQTPAGRMSVPLKRALERGEPAIWLLDIQFPPGSGGSG
jgi:hypothetical protein